MLISTTHSPAERSTNLTFWPWPEIVSLGSSVGGGSMNLRVHEAPCETFISVGVLPGGISERSFPTVTSDLPLHVSANTPAMLSPPTAMEMYSRLPLSDTLISTIHSPVGRSTNLTSVPSPEISGGGVGVAVGVGVGMAVGVGVGVDSGVGVAVGVGVGVDSGVGVAVGVGVGVDSGVGTDSGVGVAVGVGVGVDSGVGMAVRLGVVVGAGVASVVGVGSLASLYGRLRKRRDSAPYPGSCIKMKPPSPSGISKQMLPCILPPPYTSPSSPLGMTPQS